MEKIKVLLLEDNKLDVEAIVRLNEVQNLGITSKRFPPAVKPGNV